VNLHHGTVILLESSEHVRVDEFPFKTIADLVPYVFLGVCRDLAKRVCVAGGNPLVVESPTEPKWSPKGTIFLLYL